MTFLATASGLMIERVRSTAMNFSAKWMKNLAFHSSTAHPAPLVGNGFRGPCRHEPGHARRARELGRHTDSRHPGQALAAEEERQAVALPLGNRRLAKEVLERAAGTARIEPQALAAAPRPEVPARADRLREPRAGRALEAHAAA